MDKKPFLLVTALYALDQLTKLFISLTQANISVGIATIHQVTNTGASFGMFKGNNTALIFVSLMVLGYIMLSLGSIKKNQTYPLALITAGLLGNLTDRVARGHVIDFFDLGWWPVFNVADSCITIGAVWLAITLLEKNNKRRRRA